MSDFDITKVKKLTRESIENKEQPKITLEGLKAMCNFLDEENPVTYEIFLKHRPDLGEVDVAYYKNIIEILRENTRLKHEAFANNMGTYKECLEVAPPEVIVYDTKVNHIPC